MNMHILHMKTLKETLSETKTKTSPASDPEGSRSDVYHSRTRAITSKKKKKP